MKYKYFIITLQLLPLMACYSQGIEIGANAIYAKHLIELSVSNEHRSNPLHDPQKSYWTSDAEYENGILKTITLCKQSEIIYGIPNRVDYCEICVVENDTIKYTVKKFKTANIQQLKDLYIKRYAPHYIDKAYFSDDFEYCYKIYTDNENIPVVECHKTQSLKLSASTIKQIETIQRENNTIHDSTLITFNDREIIYKVSPQHGCNEEGKVVVQISIDRQGRVIEAIPGAKGTTISSECVYKQCKTAALRTKFTSSANAPETQVGTIVYNFKFGD